jgi:hypothetical protein
MFEPNEMLTYLVEPKEQGPPEAEMPEWLRNFLADDDEYDIFSK